ncbi:CHAT domain-containing protein [Rhodomicrobium vannielii]|nr:CHAT domain-containing protein [Rhodomicrobium vannielii]
MFAWLNGAQKWLEAALAAPTGDIHCEFRCAGVLDGKGRLFLNAPWELLADETGFLAKREPRIFCVARRIGRPTAQAGACAAHGDVTALFMAAAPEGAPELDYEREETAIISTTQGLSLNLAVEDSGALFPFATRVKLEGDLDVVHLSCHGNDERNALIFEDEYGDADPVTAAKLKQDGFGERLPPLIFLSACHSAEDTRKAKDGDNPLPLSMDLVQAGFPAVLGWGGPVLDHDATRFAREFYGQLVRGRRLDSAAAYARLAVLKQDDCPGRDWHLARLYLGPDGGAPLCTAGARSRPKTVLAEHGHQDILQTKQAAESSAPSRQLPVASRQSFVGRRRQTQEILRVFRAGKDAGILIHGQGKSGKTSLAARIANRLPSLKPVVIFGDYHTMAIFGEILRACPPALRPALESQWLPLIEQRGDNLGLALEAMLRGPLNQDAPILLIVDDLEQALDAPQAGQEPTTVKQEYLESLRGVVEAFAETLGHTESRLLFTSRYTFTLPDAKNCELAAKLHDLALPPMNERERLKQMQARLRLDHSKLNSTLQSQCIEAACGNPGLQELLTNAALEDAAAAGTALAAMERYLADGAVPAENKTAAFLENLALNTLVNAVDEDGRALLRAGTVLAIPVPEGVFAAIAKALALGDAGKLLARLKGLGLLDRHIADRETGEAHFLVNRLVRPSLLKEVKGVRAPKPDCPLLPGFDPGPVALTQADQILIVGAILPNLKAQWSDGASHVQLRPEALELMRLAELGQDWTLLGEAAAAGAFHLQRSYQPQAAAAVAFWALELLEAEEAHPPARLLKIGAELAGQFGHGETARTLLERGLTTSNDGFDQASLWLDWAGRQAQSGEPEDALQWLEKAKAEFERLGDVRSRAVTMGQIADILSARGDLDEALRIRREEELPVYERLGDVRSRAVTMGKIADILSARGDLDEALRIRREEELPVYERLGDVRERAVTMGQIADILSARGDLDEALRIRREEELPVYERLGDVRSRAVTMGQIADILSARGDLDEALRIRREEELPVYERLGDVRSRAVTMGQIADILSARGDLDGALRIRREEELPVYERLGDVRSRAVTMGQIADILSARGDLDEALRIRREEQLPVL